MATRKCTLGIVLAATLVGGCATAPGGLYSKPYALFESEQAQHAADTRPAMVMKIDGRNVTIGKGDPVEPGMRTVELSIPGPPGMSDPDRDTLQVDAKPCTRYYFSAKRTSPTARDWRGFVAATEPIPECNKRFPSQ